MILIVQYKSHNINSTVLNKYYDTDSTVLNASHDIDSSRLWYAVIQTQYISRK